MVQGDALDNDIQIQVRPGEIDVVGDRGFMRSFLGVEKIVVNADAGNDAIRISDLNIRSGDTALTSTDMPTEQGPSSFFIDAAAGDDRIDVTLFHQPGQVHVNLGTGADHLTMKLGSNPILPAEFLGPLERVTDGMAVDAFHITRSDGLAVDAFRVATGDGGITDGTLIDFAHAATGWDRSTSMGVEVRQVATSARDGLVIDVFHASTNDGAAVDTFHAESMATGGAGAGNVMATGGAGAGKGMATGGAGAGNVMATGGAGAGKVMAVDAFHTANSDGSRVNAFHAEGMATGGAGAGKVMAVDTFHNTSSDGAAVDAFGVENMAVDAFRTTHTDGSAVDAFHATGIGDGVEHNSAFHEMNTLIGLLSEAQADGFLPAEFMPVTNKVIELLRKAGDDKELLPAVRSKMNELSALLRTGDETLLPHIEQEMSFFIWFLPQGDVSSLTMAVKGELDAMIGVLRNGDIGLLMPAVHGELNAVIELLRKAGDDKELLPAVRSEIEMLLDVLREADAAGIIAVKSEIGDLSELLRKAGAWA
jgi:hypothetical protein